jgi:hypothetical protein
MTVPFAVTIFWASTLMAGARRRRTVPRRKVPILWSLVDIVLIYGL